MAIKTLSETNGTTQIRRSSSYSTHLIKRGIWIYFILLIFEGGLRKWVFPGLATPLLIVRDPVAFWILIMAIKKGLFPSNGMVTGMMVIGITGIFTAIFLGHGNLLVALFGARILILHFPLIFIIGRVFTRDDVIIMGKATLWISIPMAILVALQFYSPQSAWVNRGIGGDVSGGGFSGANGFFRPPATFSFITGTVAFFTLCTSFIIFFWIHQKGVNNLMLITASGALVLVIPLSISRSLFFSIALILIFTAIAIARSPHYLGKMLAGLISVIATLLIISNTQIFKRGTEAFTIRFESANEQEGGLHGVLIDRFLGGLLGALTTSSKQPFWGYGLGLGTNVGSKVSTGEISFLLSEGEWGRIIGELGPLMGIMMIFFRLTLSAQIAFASCKKMVHGNLLPWMFVSIILVYISQGQWGQPSILGFSVLAGGLAIASLKG